MIYNIIINLVCIIIIGIVLLAEYRQKNSTEKNIVLLKMMMFCALAVLISDIPGLIIDGKEFPGARVLLWIFDSVYWFPQMAYGWIGVLFTDYYLFRSHERLKKLKWIYAVPMFVGLIMVIINPVTGWLFTINEANVYSVGSTYFLSLIPIYVYIVMGLALVIHRFSVKKDAEHKRHIAIIFTFIFLAVCGILLEVFVYGVSWVWPLNTLAMLLIYVSIQQQYIADERVKAAREREKAAKLEKELINSRIRIMLSQIQPHFLYNSLAVINALCETDPQKAADAMSDFSDFLRGNMDSLITERPISFEMELSHTRHYLALEKLRYGDSVKTEYDIKVSHFRVPTLTLQPLVENAVRYGITKRESGGTVRISTCETESSYIITIKDNGIGFDMMKPYEDGRTHIGILNVRDRLKSMCDGVLQIDSVYGEGTTVVITLPKERTEIHE